VIINTRKDLLGVTNNIDTGDPYLTIGKPVVQYAVPPNKAIVGDAFSLLGIHQDGILKSQKACEIMTPESVGVPTPC
jgi:isopropylmalate/homocitrate/citramalate synthase